MAPANVTAPIRRVVLILVQELECYDERTKRIVSLHIIAYLWNDSVCCGSILVSFRAVPWALSVCADNRRHNDLFVAKEIAESSSGINLWMLSSYQRLGRNEAGKARLIPAF